MLPIFYPKKSCRVALDIQSEEICLLCIKKNRKVEAFAREALVPGAIIDGKIINNEVVLAVLRRLVRKTHADGLVTAIALPGQCVISKVIELPELLTADEWEAEIQAHLDVYLPGITGELLFDYVRLEKTPAVQQLQLIAAKKDLVDDYVGLVHQSGLKLQIIDVDYYALARVMASSINGSATVMLLDIHDSFATLIICNQFTLFVTRKINFTNDVQVLLMNLIQQVRQVMQSYYTVHQGTVINSVYLSGKSLFLETISSELEKALVLSVKFPQIIGTMTSVGLSLHGGLYG